jgi:chemotaxis family two-component system sensor histidine kinase/response regulator PixL
MAIDSDIRDQAYQFFIQEAPELLQLIEEDLLTLRTQRSTAKVHNMMRAAHSIKGGAASVGLETIKTLAHSLEDIFKGLHNQDLDIDAEVESLLLEAYDCLRLPLMEQITTGQFNSDQAIAIAEPVFAKIEAQIGDLLRVTAELPSSIELGVDIALSIFEVDVAQGLERLNKVLAAPQGQEVVGELRAQAEVFTGIAELLNLPGFGAIAQTALAALEAHPEEALRITQLALADFEAGRQAVIAGDRTQGGTVCAALSELAGLSNAPVSELSKATSVEDVFGILGEFEELPAAEPATIPSLDDVFGGFDLTLESAESQSTTSTPAKTSDRVTANRQTNLSEIVHLVEQVFDNLPPIEDISTPTEKSAAIVPAAANLPAVSEKTAIVSKQTELPTVPQEPEVTAIPNAPTPHLSVRVDLERLERMNNLVGELAINRNSLSLQNEQLQAFIQELLRRFAKFQEMGHQLRDLSDQMLVAPERYPQGRWGDREMDRWKVGENQAFLAPSLGEFDSLEMDSYGELHSMLQASLEEMVQLEETVGDVALIAGQSSQTLERQRQMLGHLRDDLVWARMLPLSEVLNRFPRMLRDLSKLYQKSVELKLNGTGVLVDKAALEKLSDPLVHLVRNAFDHGIEPPEVRRQNGKPEQGLIEIRAYHQGSQTMIEVRDDGRGINLERIRSKALQLGLLSPEQVATTDSSQLLELLFEPGFSTASQVSQLSGRGVGLDVVRAQVRSLKGTVTLISEPGHGTVFTLRIPLTLTIAKLLVCFVGSTAFALPSDSITEILIPQPDQVKQSSGKRFLQWQGQIIPAYHLSQLLNYACPLPETQPSQVLATVPTPDDWAPPMLLMSQDDQFLALEIDRLVTEQELVIKPLGEAIAPPSYIYGCTILSDGCLIPVIDAAGLLNSLMGEAKTATTSTIMPSLLIAELNENSSDGTMNALSAPRDTTCTVLVVDDSITVRQTLALTLEKADYRVLQARDGREAIKQLQQNLTVQLVICDVEMPNMNGFEFLSQRRQDPVLSQIPVVMLTSRSSDKHRQLAMHLGAKAYFTKPYIEQEFLAALKTIRSQDATVGVSALPVSY